MKPIMFFADTIAILPHTATAAERVGVCTTLRDFITGQRASLYENEEGEYLCRREDGEFIQGPEITKAEILAMDVAGLENLYTPSTGWGEHPTYSREDWKYEVRSDDTQVGYWEWVYNRLHSEE